MSGRSDLVEVRLIGFPLDVYAAVQETHEGLMREFALIAHSEPGRSVPARLVALTKALQDRYDGFAQGAREQRATAAERGDITVDIVYEVPLEIGEAAAEYDTLLDEAVEYCRNGDLLTLAPPDEHLAFRRWFLGEFVRQARGEQATPWREYRVTSRDR